MNVWILQTLHFATPTPVPVSDSSVDRKETENPAIARSIATLIEKREFRKAHDSLVGLEGKLGEKVLRSLHAQNVTTWLRDAQEEFNEKRYQNAAAALAPVRDSYPNELAVLLLEEALNQKRQELDKLQLDGLEASTSANWRTLEKAFASAKRIEQEFPDQKILAERIREAALPNARSLREKRLQQAGQEKPWERACQLLIEAHQISQRIEECDDASVGKLASAVMKELVRRGQSIVIAGPDVQLKVLAEAVEAGNPTFARSLESILANNSIDKWDKAKAVEMAHLFLRWADMQPNKVEASVLAVRLQPALQMALDKAPDDADLNLWMGIVLWQRKADEAEKQKAYVCFGRVLAKSKAPMDKFERSAYAAIGNDAHDRLAAVSSALPTDRTKLTAQHTQLLLKRLVLIRENSELLKEDLKRSVPSFLADADDIARLEVHPAYVAQAHAAVWLAVEASKKANLIPAGQEAAYEQHQIDHLAKLEKLLLQDKTYKWTGALGWAKYCAQTSKDPETAKSLQGMIDRHTRHRPNEA